MQLPKRFLAIVTSLAAASLVFALLTPATAAQEEPVVEPDLSAPIVGVNPLAPEGKYPALVFLQVEWSDGRLGSCTGALVHQYWVLTAAHCLVSAGQTSGTAIDALEVTAVIGSTDIRGDLRSPDLPPGVEVQRTQAWIVRGDYDPARNTVNDVALVRLPKASAVAPMPIATNSALVNPVNDDARLPAAVVGYGVSSCAGGTCAGTDFLLHEGVSSIVTDNEASRVGRVNIPALERAHNFFLAPDIATQAATCYGDSGGPVLSGPYIIGVVSFGTQAVCDQPGALNGMTDVVTSELGVWVRQVITAAPVTCNGRVAHIVGTPGNDAIFGGPGSDSLIGGDGIDYIDGRDGDDSICGGNGVDGVRGGPGNDFISGGNGNDVLDGESGADTIEGNSGNDRLNGAAGKDDLSGGKGNDELNGGNSNDKLNGGAGKDEINGGAGNDNLKGQGGKDTLNGNKGKDKLNGGPGKDKLNGGSGKDSLLGGSGNDNLKGQAGRDTLNGNKGRDTLNGGGGSDKCTTDSRDRRSTSCER